MKKLLVIINILIIFSVSYGFEKEQTAESVRRDLEKIRNDIKLLEEKIQNEKKQEQKTDISIQSLAREIQEQRKLIRKISLAEKQTEQAINLLIEDISVKEKKISSLQNLIKSRIVHLYKYGRTNEIEAILSSESFSQVFVRLKYILFFTNRDKKYIKQIKTNVEDLQKKNNILLQDLESKKEIITKKRNESLTLSKKQQLLEKKKSEIKKNQKAYLDELKKKENSEKRLLELFTNLSKERKTPSSMLPPVGTPFNELKGKLIWPVNGPIISHFGINYNKELKTRIDNYGIDIKASLGTDVCSVWHGRILMVQWFPGFGPVLIIEHDSGYLTSYAHLSEILVELGETVYPGKIVARIGDEESYDGPKLNFQIWKDGNKLNPEIWLERKRREYIKFS